MTAPTAARLANLRRKHADCFDDRDACPGPELLAALDHVAARLRAIGCDNDACTVCDDVGLPYAAQIARELIEYIGPPAEARP